MVCLSNFQDESRNRPRKGFIGTGPCSAAPRQLCRRRNVSSICFVYFLIIRQTQNEINLAHQRTWFATFSLRSSAAVVTPGLATACKMNCELQKKLIKYNFSSSRLVSFSTYTVYTIWIVLTANRNWHRLKAPAVHATSAANRFQNWSKLTQFIKLFLWCDMIFDKQTLACSCHSQTIFVTCFPEITLQVCLQWIACLPPNLLKAARHVLIRRKKSCFHAMVRQTKMNMAISQYFSHAYSLEKQVEISPPKANFF